jgi:hypothetical protein
MSEAIMEKIASLLEAIREDVNSIVLELHEKNLIMRSVLGGTEAQELLAMLSAEEENEQVE